MADNEVKTPGKKSNPAVFIGIIVAILLLLGGVMLIANPPVPQTTETTTEQATNPDGTITTATVPAEIDINAALSDRILGSTSAPVSISEHASFTCSHCGDFHRETFDKLKAEYIDTGKVSLTYSDFPLNQPAAHATMIARCLPQDKYFDFVHMLFEKQKDWAYDSNYLDFLKAEAAKNGLDEAHFQACIDSKELADGIMNRMKGIQQQWNITATPSFIINHRNVVSGALPYEEFKKIIDAELAKPATAPVTEAPAAAETEATTEEPTADVVEETPAPEEAPAAETPAATETPAAPAESSTSTTEESAPPAE